MDPSNATETAALVRHHKPEPGGKERRWKSPPWRFVEISDWWSQLASGILCVKTAAEEKLNN
jgi:hypothetical protein